jgi:hypothetical protein
MAALLIRIKKQSFEEWWHEKHTKTSSYGTLFYATIDDKVFHL